MDPTYVKEDIEKDPVDSLAFALSEIMNDNAPIGWSKYRPHAANLLANYYIAPKQKAVANSAMEVMYTNYRGETARRWIIPRNIRFGASEWHKEPTWLLLAFDVAKNADREFDMRALNCAKT